MDDFTKRVRASLENPNGDPWFPELTAELAVRAWDSLHRDIGLKRDNYGTERVMSRDISAPRAIIASLETGPSTGAATPAISIEALTQECAAEYQKKGASIYSPDEILHTTVLSCIEDALAIINQVPSLMRTVAVLVRSLHVLKPESANYDVSFSEPAIPFSIFVSVPNKRIANDGLRVAEAIVHEAMHLQLTLMEKIISFVMPQTNKYYSPWRREYRDAQGVLHALYVFRVIDRFMERLTELENPKGDEATYAYRRRYKIKEQMTEIESFHYCGGLTSVGTCFAKRLA